MSQGGLRKGSTKDPSAKHIRCMAANMFSAKVRRFNFKAQKESCFKSICQWSLFLHGSDMHIFLRGDLKKTQKRRVLHAFVNGRCFCKVATCTYAFSMVALSAKQRPP